MLVTQVLTSVSLLSSAVVIHAAEDVSNASPKGLQRHSKKFQLRGLQLNDYDDGLNECVEDISDDKPSVSLDTFEPSLIPSHKPSVSLDTFEPTVYPTQGGPPRSSCIATDVGLSFNDAVLIQNNLGGVGPDSGEQEMRFNNVGTYNGQTLDFVVSVKPGSVYNLNNDGEKYNNGIYSSDFGRIAHNELRKSSTLVMKIEDAATKSPVVLPGFVFSVFQLQVYNNIGWDCQVTGWTTAQYYTTGAQATFSESGTSRLDASSKYYAGSLYVSDPYALNDTAEKRAFQVTFEDVSSFEVVVTTSTFGDVKKGTPAQQFWFSFNSELSTKFC